MDDDKDWIILHGSRDRLVVNDSVELARTAPPGGAPGGRAVPGGGPRPEDRLNSVTTVSVIECSVLS